ncbi:uncharacterized protein LOC142333819 [Lycorma delicatula]|uniref:uncharacterized protein LOC142333819 n=1 Tax=Lycorma delicatula TaxID=130591 RepID=UPI003F5152F2
MADYREGYLAKNEKELIHQIKNYFSDLKVCESDIRVPTTILVVEFYKLFLNEFYVDVNNVMQIQMNQALVENTDMYLDLIPLLNLTAAIKKFQIPALKDFSVFDLTNPKPKRTFNQMAHVMHFVYFADSRVGTLEPKLNKIREKALRKQELLVNIDKLKQQVNNRAIEMAEKKTGLKDRNEEIGRLTSEIVEMNHESEILTEKLNNLKLEYSKVKSSSKKLDAERQVLENDVNEFKRQVNEMKIIENQEDQPLATLSTAILEEKVKDSTEKCKEMRETLISKQNTYELQTKQYEAQTIRNEVLKEITHLIEEKLKCEPEQERISNEIKDNTKNLEKIKCFISETESEVDKNKEELIKVELQWSKQKSSLKESCDTAKEKFENQENIIKTKQEQADIINNEINDLNSKIDSNDHLADVLYDAYEIEYSEEMEEASKCVEHYKRTLEKFGRQH